MSNPTNGKSAEAAPSPDGTSPDEAHIVEVPGLPGVAVWQTPGAPANKVYLLDTGKVALPPLEMRFQVVFEDAQGKAAALHAFGEPCFLCDATPCVCGRAS